MTPLLEVADLHLGFPLRGGKDGVLRAVDGVSFRLDAGEAVALVGESGCGKSTLARLVARLIDPDGGTIRLDGADLAAIPARRFARHPARARIQMVFQDAGDSLDPRYTAARAIAEPIRGLTRLSAAATAARVLEIASLAGLAPELLGRTAHQLSGGQKARVGIARALGPQPQLLILDEPTAALDVSVQALVLRLFDDLRVRLRVAVLFITHDLNVQRLLCPRVMVMYLGRIVETGPSDAVFTSPLHPYTQALVAAVPNPSRAARPGTPRLDRDVAGAIAAPSEACRFANRCPVVMPRCRSEMPILRIVAPGRLVACHRDDLP